MLKQKIIVVTRAKHQAHALCAELKAQAAIPFLFPTLVIKHEIPANDPDLQGHYDIAIFTSANAVSALPTPVAQQHAVARLSIAIGPGTLQALHNRGLTADRMPALYSTEGLLALPCLETVLNKKIIIFCGDNARKDLKEALQKRGAHVTAWCCYRRLCPSPTPLERHALLRLPMYRLISTSQESLHNLFSIFPENEKQRLLCLPLLVISPAMLTLAHTLGFHASIDVAKNASDSAILAALLASV